MTLTLEVPEEVLARLTETYPDETERNRALLGSIVETIEAEQQEKSEWIETIHARLDALEAGGKTYSLDEAWEQLDRKQAERLQATKQ